MKAIIFKIMLEELRMTAAGTPTIQSKLNIIEQLISECEELHSLSTTARTFTGKHDCDGMRIHILDIVKIRKYSKRKFKNKDVGVVKAVAENGNLFVQVDDVASCTVRKVHTVKVLS